jgi:predicted PolB exonuclease-like 3'-5' exonuclease
MPATSYLVIDIETIIDRALPQEGRDESSGLPAAPFHQVVVIGALWLDADCKVERIGVIAEGKGEREILEDFTRFVGERQPHLVTYNGRGFDMPVIGARCLRHGVPFRHYYASRDVRYRFSPFGHLDLMDFIADFGAARAARLDIVAKSVGMPGKVGIEGKDVGPMVHAGRLAEVQAYCLCDVAQTAGVFLRLQLVRGELSREAYLEAMRVLIHTIESEERLSAVAAAIDKPRLLLDEPAMEEATPVDDTAIDAAAVTPPPPSATTND